MFTSELIASYWSTPEIITNVVILLHLFAFLFSSRAIAYIPVFKFPLQYPFPFMPAFFLIHHFH